MKNNNLQITFPVQDQTISANEMIDGTFAVIDYPAQEGNHNGRLLFRDGDRLLMLSKGPTRVGDMFTRPTSCLRVRPLPPGTKIELTV